MRRPRSMASSGPGEGANDGRLSQVLDVVLQLKPWIAAHIERRWGTFSPRFDLLPYDVTGAYLDGPAERSRVVEHGRSPRHRRDSKWAASGPQCRECPPLGYGAFVDSRSYVAAVCDIVKTIAAANRVPRKSGSPTAAWWTRKASSFTAVSASVASWAWRGPCCGSSSASCSPSTGRGCAMASRSSSSLARRGGELCPVPECGLRGERALHPPALRRADRSRSRAIRTDPGACPRAEAPRT